LANGFTSAGDANEVNFLGKNEFLGDLSRDALNFPFDLIGLENAC
jgi:hypothetical protein